MIVLREFLRMSQHRTNVVCYLLLSLWIFLLIAGKDLIRIFVYSIHNPLNTP